MPESTTVAGPVRGRLGDLPDRCGLGGGEVLGEAAEHLGEHETDDDGAEALPAGVGLVVADVDEGDDRGADDREDAGGEEAAVDRRHRRLVLVGGPHREHADDRREHADGAGGEREDQAERGVQRRSTANAATPRMIDATSVTS